MFCVYKRLAILIAYRSFEYLLSYILQKAIKNNVINELARNSIIIFF